MGKGTFICLVIPVSVGVQSQQFVRVERLLVSASRFALTSSARWGRTAWHQSTSQAAHLRTHLKSGEKLQLHID